jgi:hypothetical protein
MTAYKKLKQENTNLKRMIYDLIMKADHPDTIAFVKDYKQQVQFSDILWFSSPTSNTSNGLLNKIQK